LAVMATHQEEELRAAARALGAAARAVGFDPRMRIAPAPTPAPGRAQDSPADDPDLQRSGDRELARPAVFDFEADEPVRRAA
jgi:hypothetical protein